MTIENSEELSPAEKIAAIIERDDNAEETTPEAQVETEGLKDLDTEDHDLGTAESGSEEQATGEPIDENHEVTDESVQAESLEEVETDEDQTDDQNGDAQSEFELPQELRDIDRESLGEEAQALYDKVVNSTIEKQKNLQADYTRKTQEVSSIVKTINKNEEVLDYMVNSYNSDPEVVEALGRKATREDLFNAAIAASYRLMTDEDYNRQVYEQLHARFGEEYLEDTSTEASSETQEEIDQAVEESKTPTELEKRLAEIEAREAQREFEAFFNNQVAEVQEKFPDLSSSEFEKITREWWILSEEYPNEFSLADIAQDFYREKEELKQQLKQELAAKEKELLKSKTSTAPVAAAGKGKTGMVAPGAPADLREKILSGEIDPAEATKAILEQ